MGSAAMPPYWIRTSSEATASEPVRSLTETVKCSELVEPASLRLRPLMLASVLTVMVSAAEATLMTGVDEAVTSTVAVPVETPPNSSVAVSEMVSVPTWLSLSVRLWRAALT